MLFDYNIQLQSHKPPIKNSPEKGLFKTARRLG